MDEVEQVPGVLNPDELALAVGDLDGWTVVEDRLRRELRLGDFPSAFALMSYVAVLAERWNHHPEWSNVYDRVTIELTTHDAGGISGLDVQMAAAIDGYVAQRREAPS